MTRTNIYRIPVCGLCGYGLSKRSKGKKCYRCGAIFTNPEILQVRENYN